MHTRIAVLDDYPDLLTVREVATILRVDRSYVYRLIREGRLPVLRPTPHKTRVVKAELHAFLDATRPGAPRTIAPNPFDTLP